MPLIKLITNTFSLPQLVPFVYNVSQFQSDAGHMKAVEPLLRRALDLLVRFSVGVFVHNNEFIDDYMPVPCVNSKNYRKQTLYSDNIK